jgi:hypothetical protein
VDDLPVYNLPDPEDPGRSSPWNWMCFSWRSVEYMEINLNSSEMDVSHGGIPIAGWLMENP